MNDAHGAAWCEAGHSGFLPDAAVSYEFEYGRPPMSVRAVQGFRLPTGRLTAAGPVVTALACFLSTAQADSR